MYNRSMASAKGKKKSKKAKRGMKTKITLMPDDEGASENDGNGEDEEEGGMVLEKEDLKLIYNALRGYKPTEDEEHLHSVLVEEFEEVLVVDYNEPYPDAN